MHPLTQLIKNDMVPALGVTEPGAIAFAVAKARTYAKGRLVRLNVEMNSGMYKNAFTCGIPYSDHVGAVYAAALGYVAGRADKGLEALAYVTPEDNAAARDLVETGKVRAVLSGMTSRIFIQARLETTESKVEVTIRDSHTNITRIVVDGSVLLQAPREAAASPGREGAEAHPIHAYSLAQMVDYVQTVPAREIAFVQEAYDVNLALFRAALASPRTTFAPQLLAANGGKIISQDERRTASLLCNAAIEGRVLGLDKPAMAITGSGAHGLIATLPLYAVCQIRRLPDEQLWRATMLSYLICTYIKEYSGRLSAFCGCGIAAGTGMAVACAWLKGAELDGLTYVINNMASSLTGMICDGGNQGCTMKGICAVATAFESVDLALAGVHVDSIHGICGTAPEETMRNMGRVASPGMVETEKTIVAIQAGKGPAADE